MDRVETIFPIQNPHALQDQRVSSLIQYAMKVEKAMFETATSREAYYQLLAEKIYRIRKELEERKRMRMEIEKRRPGSTMLIFFSFYKLSICQGVRVVLHFTKFGVSKRRDV